MTLTPVKGKPQMLAFEKSVVLKLCKGIASPRALAVSLLVENDEWAQLLALTTNPDNYTDAHAFGDDYLVTEVMKKNPRLPSGIDTRTVALEKFRDAERRCDQTNQRLLHAIESHHFDDLDVRRTLFTAIEIIRSILGPLTRADLAFAEANFGFGPGTTTSLKGDVTYSNKYKHRILDASPRVVDFLLYSRPSGWDTVDEIAIRSFSKLTTVPKNAKTDRCICIEPDLNVFVQRGIGRLLRSKLSRFGLDLGDQTVNQRLACAGSKNDDLVTLDLSAASDSVSREAVWMMLPDRWSELLYFARTDQYVDPTDGVVKTFHKWSSMGNGYTFELETLIFHAISLAACQVVDVSPMYVSTYGDDMIFPSEALDVIVRTLNFLGFKVNTEKSFGTGQFRESCGADFFNGINVRPFYLRSRQHDFEEVCYTYANSIRRTAHRSNCGVGCDVRYLSAWLYCFTAVKPGLRYRIPEGFGDVGFVSNFDESRATVCRRDGRVMHGIYSFAYSGKRTFKRYGDERGACIASLNRQMPPFSFGKEDGRSPRYKKLTKRGITAVWPNLGPWL